MASKYTFLIFLFLFNGFVGFSQEEEKEEAPAYQMLYDDPYDIRNFYLQFQPLYGDIGAINITGGFGIEGAYYHKSKFDLQLAFRTSYGKKFDINRDAATNNATNSTDEFPMYFNIELGGTYHIKDVMKESSSKVLLYSKQYTGIEWASTVPRSTEINGNVRNIIGARLGGMFSSTTANINTILSVQEIDLYDSEGLPILNEDVYSNLQTFIIYVGGSYSWIRNYAVEFSERWDPSGDDQLITPYIDIMYAASVNLNDVTLNGETVSTADIEELSLGFRGGVNVKFNRKLSWGYGVEAGIKPGIKKRGFFLVFKMSFPLYAKKLGTKETAPEESGN